MNKLNVLYAVNDKYCDIMLGSIYSLILNSHILDINLHIIVDDFKEEDYLKVENALRHFPHITYYFYDLNSFKDMFTNLQGMPIVNARLFFQSILGANIAQENNLLYLDADTIVTGSLENLLKYPNPLVGAVKDEIYKPYLKKLDSHLQFYCNSGVLFFNVQKWFQDNYEDNIRRFKEQAQGKYSFQDFLNLSLHNAITLLPKEYNMQTVDFEFSPLGNLLYFSSPLIDGSFKEIEEAKKHPKIIHSAGFANIKPWDFNQSNPFNQLFRDYLFMANPSFKLQHLPHDKETINDHIELYKALTILQSYLAPQYQDLSRKLMPK